MSAFSVFKYILHKNGCELFSKISSINKTYYIDYIYKNNYFDLKGPQLIVMKKGPLR